MKRSNHFQFTLFLLVFYFLQGNQLYASLGNLPIVFEKNQGQYSADIKYQAQVGRTGVRFLSEGISYYTLDYDSPSNITARVWNLHWGNTSPLMTIEQSDPNDLKFNYYLGENSANWQEQVPTFNNITYKNIYSNINLKFYRNDNDLEYDFEVLPGADISQIKMNYDGVNQLFVNAQGHLNIQGQFGNITETKPVAYQIVNGVKHLISTGFHQIDSMSIGFEINEPYDTALPLIIDPITLQWSAIFDINMVSSYKILEMDHSAIGVGNQWLYVTGQTAYQNVPTLPGNYTVNSKALAFVGAIADNGNSGYQFISVFSGNDVLGSGTIGRDIKFTPSKVVVSGTSFDADFPDFPSSLYNGSTIPANGVPRPIVIAVDIQTGVKLFCGDFGGQGNGYGVETDNSGNIYVAGTTLGGTSFYTNIGSTTTTDLDAFVVKLNASLNSTFSYKYLLASTGQDSCTDIKIDNANRIWLGGYTAQNIFPSGNSSNMLVTSGSGSVNGGAYLLRLVQAGNGSSASIDKCLLLKGDGFNCVYRIDLDNAQNLYAVGNTESTNLPTTANALSDNLFPVASGFAWKNSTSGTPALSYLTYIEGCKSQNYGVGQNEYWTDLGLRVDKGTGDAYIATQSYTNYSYDATKIIDNCTQNFPANDGDHFGRNRMLLYKLKSNGQQLQWLTKWGLPNASAPFKVVASSASSPVFGANGVYYAFITNRNTFPITPAPTYQWHAPLELPVSGVMCFKEANTICNAGPGGAVCANDPFTLGGTPTIFSPAGSNIQYEWTASDNSYVPPVANPTVNPSATTTYTLHVKATDGDGNSCDLTSCSTTVTIAQPVLTFNEIPCGGTGTTVTITKPGGSTSGSSFSLDGGTYQTSNVFLNVGEGLHTYDIKGSCSGQGTFTVTRQSCCMAEVKLTNPNVDMIVNHPALHPYVTINAGTVNLHYNGSLLIEGTFTVNQNFNFERCPSILMGNNATIQVMPSEKLTIQGSFIQACDKMWNGIYASNASSSIVIQNYTNAIATFNSQISDALCAVNVTSAPISITDCVFENNYQSINYSNETINNVSISGCTFRTVNSGIKGWIKNGTLLNAGKYGYSGIMSAQSTSAIGKNNVFSNLNVGIFSFWSETSIHDNYFDNIQMFNKEYFGTKPKDIFNSGGGAIISVGHYQNNFFGNPNENNPAPSGTALSKLLVYYTGQGYSDYHRRYSHTNCLFGIKSTGCEVLVDGAQMFGVNQGIVAQLAINRDVQILNSTIRETTGGISCVLNPGANVLVHNDSVITKNWTELEASEAQLTYQRYGHGIGVIELSSQMQGAASNDVLNNTVISHSKIGIYLKASGNSKIRNTRVSANDVTVVPHSKSGCPVQIPSCTSDQVGIQADQASGTIFNDNLVHGVNFSFSNGNRTIGLKANQSQDLLVQCNGFSQLRHGLYAYGNCNTHDLDEGLKGNHFADHYDGIYLLNDPANDGTFGDVCSGNRENNNEFAGNFALRKPAGNLPFYPLMIYRQTANVVQNFPDLIQTDASYTNLTQNNSQCNVSGFEVKVKPEVLASKWSCESYSPGSQLVYQPQAGDHISRLKVQLEDMIYGMMNYLNTDYFQPAALYIDRQYVFSQIYAYPALRDSSAVIDSFAKANDDPETRKLEETKLGFDSLMLDSTIDQAKWDALAMKLQELQSAEVFEANEARMLQFHQRLYDDSLDFSDQDADEIFAMANSCPYINGPAVYMARSLYALYDPLYSFDDLDACANAVTSKNGKPLQPFWEVFEEQQQSNVSETDNLLLIPNPNDGIFSLHWNDNSVTRIRILDVKGVVVYDTETMGENTKEVKLLVVPGFYTAELLAGKRHSGSAKFIVTR
ncbi:MAG: PKD domain-containing protein [Chitinophagales bacterium]